MPQGVKRNPGAENGLNLVDLLRLELNLEALNGVSSSV